MNYTGRECDVSPYYESYDAITNVSIVAATTAWTFQVTGRTYILFFHEAFAMQEQDHTLVNLNQLRAYMTIPSQPPTAMHVTSLEEEPIIPLLTDGTVIYFDTRTPTAQDLYNYPHVQRTSKSPWNPRSVRLPEPVRSAEEEKMMQISVVQ